MRLTAEESGQQALKTLWWINALDAAHPSGEGYIGYTLTTPKWCPFRKEAKKCLEKST